MNGILPINAWIFILGFASILYIGALGIVLLRGFFLALKKTPERRETIQMMGIRVFWLICLYALLPYAFVADVSKYRIDLGAPARTVTIAISVLLAIASAFLILKGSIMRNFRSYWIHCLVRWSFVTFIAINGLILTFFGISKILFAIFWLTAFTLMLKSAPSRHDREQFDLMRHNA